GFDEQTAGSYAQIIESGFRSLGDRAGMDPVELFERYGLQIERQDEVTPAQEPAFQQGADVQKDIPLPDQVSVVAADSGILEMEPFSPGATKEMKRPFQNAALSHAKKNFQGKSFLNRHTGWEIDVSKSGLSKASTKAV